MLSSTKKISGFFDAAYFVDDLVDRAARLRIAEIGLNRRRIRSESGSPGRPRPARPAGSVCRRRSTGRDEARSAEDAAAAGRLAASGRREIVQHGRPQSLRLADHNRFGVFAGFVRDERGMKPAHHDGHAAAAETRKRSDRSASPYRSRRSSPPDRLARRRGSIRCGRRRSGSRCRRLSA